MNMKNLLKYFAFFLLPLFVACSGRVQNPRFVINEVLVINEQNYVDDYGKRSGWIEIFNNSAKTQDIGGLFLTNDRSNPRRRGIAPKVWASLILGARSGFSDCVRHL